jgi:hypothetical protein
VRRRPSHDGEPEKDGEGEAAVVDEEAEDFAEYVFKPVHLQCLLGVGWDGLRTAAAEGHDGERENEIGCDESQDRPVGSGPFEVQALADPEGSEGREQDANDEFECVFGDSGERAVQDEAEGSNNEESGDGSQAGGEEHAGVAGSDGDDNEDDLSALEHGDVEGGGEGDLVPFGWADAETMHSLGVLLEGCLFVVERDLTGGTKDGFAQPAKAEQQEKRADDKLDDGQRNAGERCSECSDDEEQNSDGCGSAGQCGSPAADAADGEDDGKGFYAFDEGCEEGCENRRSYVCPADAHALILVRWWHFDVNDVLN